MRFTVRISRMDVVCARPLQRQPAITARPLAGRGVGGVGPARAYRLRAWRTRVGWHTGGGPERPLERFHLPRADERTGRSGRRHRRRRPTYEG